VNEYSVDLPLDRPTAQLRELLAIREIAHALLVADRPEDVHQFALDRVTPLLGAQFSLVMRLGDDGELLRPVAQYEWPAKYRAWIGALRVRVGSGPSGLAVENRQLVEVRDLFADRELEDWYEVANELGFRSILAAPLVGARGVMGAIAFYFASETEVSDEQRALVRLVADQLAATADKAVLIQELRRSNAALAEANSQLERIANDAEASRISRERFFHQIVRTIAESLEGSAASPGVMRAHLLALASVDLLRSERGVQVETASEVEPRTPLLASVNRIRQQNPTVPIHVDEPVVMLPIIQASETGLRRLLDIAIAYVARDAGAQGGSVRTAIDVGRGFLSYRATWQTGTTEGSQPDPELALARSLSRQLGGEMQLERIVAESGDELTLTLIFPVDTA